MPGNPTCETCRWWDVTAGKQSGDGACRAFAPRVRYNEFGGDAFPITKSSEWCGEHAPRAKARGAQRVCRMHPGIPVSGADLFMGFPLCDACWGDQVEAYAAGMDRVHEFVTKIRRGPV